MHSSFINGWDKEANWNMTDTLTKPRSFQSLFSPSGKSKDGTVCKAKAADKGPQNGTDNYESNPKMMRGRAAAAPVASNTPFTTVAPSTTTAATTSATATPIPNLGAAEKPVEGSCMNPKRSIESRSKRAALKRKLVDALAALDELEQ